MLSDQEMCDLYALGDSIAKVAEQDGRSESTIYHRLKRCVKLRSRSQANCKFSTAIAIALYNLGLSVAQVGEILEVHPTTIIKRLTSDGFPLRIAEVAIRVGWTQDEFDRAKTTGVFLGVLNGR